MPLAGVGFPSLPPPQWGNPVLRIRLECDARLSLERFADLVTQKVGEPLDRAKVAESLKNLYATGRFRELRADAEPLDSGVELIFVARAIFFVGTVRVEGAPGHLDPRLLITAARLRLGQPIQQDDLASARARLAAVLAENGYCQAKVGHRLVPNMDNQQADIVFSVIPGPPARLSAVEFKGRLFAPPERLAAASGWRPGLHLTAARVERGIFKIRRFYASQGRPQGTASIRDRIYNPQQHTEKLLAYVEAGPLLHVHIQGARVSSSKTKELLPLFREGVVDESTLARGQKALEDHFERKGYHSVSVKVARKFNAESQESDVTYTVTLGARGEFAGYAFSGNHSLPASELAAALSVHPKDFFGERGILSRDLLTRDVNALTALYQARGFLEARVTPLVNERHENQPGRLFITFQIEEGPRTKVGQVAIRGLDLQMQKGIWPFLLTRPGKPYAPGNAQTDRDFILSYLADRGYFHATATWHASPVSPSHEVDLEYRIEPGVPEEIRRIIIMGNEHTRTGIVRRELTVRDGGPLSQRDILESQRRLYELGIFSQVQIATQDPQSPEAGRTVLVNVEEARRWTVGYGGGMEVQRLGSNQPQGQFKASPRLSLEVTRLNVGGRAQTLSLRGRFSSLEKGGAISYLIPRFPTRRDLTLRLNALVDRSRDVLTFTAKRQEASVSIEKHYSPTTLLLARFSFRRVDASDVRIRPELLPLLSRPARVAMLGLSYANDHRNDPTDATEGSYSLADAGMSWQKVGSQSNFLRVSGQNATYHRLSPHLVFARNTRLAVESTVGQVSPTGDIPLPERFFMGGSESHRGFSINQAGPRDLVTGFPIGGNALFLNSLELRVGFAEDRLGFVFFHDAGNVFSSFRRMRLLKFTQRSPTDFDYTLHAAGLGIRYRTPVGPLRFDVGYNPNPPHYQVVMNNVVEVRRLSRFQFFLSVGQSF